MEIINYNITVDKIFTIHLLLNTDIGKKYMLKYYLMIT